MPDSWQDALRDHRRQKDEYFASDPRSPLPESLQHDFEGLAYYLIDPTYRFEVPLEEHDEKKSVTVGTSTGTERTFSRWGSFTLDIKGQTGTLQAYKADPDADRLWVPFRDGTSGEITYGAGRYLDLEPDRHQLNDHWIVDFNEAYNPTCVYSDQYECPLPPTENWLDVPIEAGEQSFDQRE